MSIKVNTDGSFEVQDIEQALALSERLKLNGAAAGTRPPPTSVPAASVEAAAAAPLWRRRGQSGSNLTELVLGLLSAKGPLDNLGVIRELNPQATPGQRAVIRQMLLRMSRLGLVRRDHQGAWSPTSKSSTSTFPRSPQSRSSPSPSPSSLGRAETKMACAVALVRETGQATLEEVGETGPMGSKRTSVLLCALVRSRKLQKGERGTPWTIGPTS